ncbi:MAG: hypothetical protein ACRDHY_00375, partial [Anaerolineales bacterium]
MNKLRNAVTPAVLIAAAFPLLFVLAPDGIPFAYAACGGPRNGTITNSAITVCRSCWPNQGSGDYIQIHSCSLTPTTGSCRLTASVTLSIETSDTCETEWDSFCELNVCASNTLAIAGPCSSVTVSHTLDCNAEGDDMIIQLSHRD